MKKKVGLSVQVN